jgi:hypothetical protein
LTSAPAGCTFTEDKTEYRPITKGPSPAQRPGAGPFCFPPEGPPVGRRTIQQLDPPGISGIGPPVGRPARLRPRPAALAAGPGSNSRALEAQNGTRNHRHLLRPSNPTFLLDENEAREIVRQLAAEPDTATSEEVSTGILGYRGMILELEEDESSKLALPRRLRVGGGVAKREARGLELAQRLIERAGKLTPAVKGDFGSSACTTRRR